MRKLAWIAVVLCSSVQAGMHLRKEGIRLGPFPTGKNNSISDVRGVKVGHATLNKTIGKSVVRTGVTVVLPTEDDAWDKPLPAAVYTFNGVGEATGFATVKELGVLQSPIALTNTLSIGEVQKALSQWMIKKHPESESPVPIVMECDDNFLNDIHGFHVTGDHVLEAIKNASSQFAEGSVGAGTGSVSFDFKSGIGSASRVVTESKKEYTVGVLVNSNLGTDTRQVFRFMGQQVSKLIKDLKPTERPWAQRGAGSIVMVVATDMPLDSRQLERLAKRAFAGVFRLGIPGYNGSGDFVIAFSTANRVSGEASRISSTRMCDPCLNDIYEAMADASEEAILVSLLASPDMKGRSGNTVYAMPLQRLKPHLKLAD